MFVTDVKYEIFVFIFGFLCFVTGKYLQYYFFSKQFYQFRQQKDLLHIFVKQLLRACAEEAFKTFLGLKHNIKQRQEAAEESVLISEQVPDIEEKRARLSKFLEEAIKYRRIPGNLPSEEEEDEEEEGDRLEAHRVGDPHCDLSVASVRSVEGRTDSAGLPLGRCLVTLHTGDELSGVWRRGRREGQGTARGPGLEQRGVRSIRGYYKDGLLSGPAQLSLTDGAECCVQFVRGLAQGPVVTTFTRTESDLDTETLTASLVTTGPAIGRYSRGVLAGPVWLALLGGGWLHGVPDQRGELTGDDVMYVYPDLATILWGTFSRGVMVRAVHTTIADVGNSLKENSPLLYPALQTSRAQSRWRGQTGEVYRQARCTATLRPPAATCPSPRYWRTPTRGAGWRWCSPLSQVTTLTTSSQSKRSNICCDRSW